MEDESREVFETRAPFVNVDELVDLLTSEVLSAELLERGSSIWVFGSFANPTKSLDTSSQGRSDLDIFVVHDGWEYPQVATYMLLYAPDESIPREIPERVEENDWSETESLAGPREWDCSIEEAWGKVPDYVKETLRNASKKGFFRNREEHESGKIRYYDVFVGEKRQLDAQRRRATSSDSDPLPGFEIHSLD